MTLQQIIEEIEKEKKPTSPSDSPTMRLVKMTANETLDKCISIIKKHGDIEEKAYKRGYYEAKKDYLT